MSQNLKKPKILYVLCSQIFSGAEIVIERLILGNLDYVTPIVICPPGLFAERLIKKNIFVIKENALSALERKKKRYNKLKLFIIILKKYILITRRIARTLKQEKIFTVHANNLAAAFYLLPSILLSKLKNKKIKWVWSNHDLTYPDGRKSEKLAQSCHKNYDLTLAVSKAVKLKFKDYDPKITVLYNGIDTERFRFKTNERLVFRTQHKIPNDCIVIGILGSISERKGHDLLISAYKNLLNEYPDLVLFIIGNFSPGEKEFELRIRKMVKSLHGGRLILSEPREDIENVYSGLDIIVNATISKFDEPLGTTIYEGMACERIVLASKTGGTTEIIDEMENGILFKADDLEDLTEKLHFIVSHKSELDPLRINARKKVLSRFGIEQMVTNYNQILKKI